MSGYEGARGRPAPLLQVPALQQAYCMNIPSEWDDDELCLSFKNVVRGVVVYDRETRKSKGFGFVRFESEQHLAEALQRTNGMDFAGRRVKVERARRDWTEQAPQAPPPSRRPESPPRVRERSPEPYRGGVPYAADRERERGWEAAPPVREAWRGERAQSPLSSRSRDRPAYDRDRAPPYRSEASYAPREPSPPPARPYRGAAAYADPYATAVDPFPRADPYAAAASAPSASARADPYSRRAAPPVAAPYDHRREAAPSELAHYSSRAGAAYAHSQPSAYSRSPPRDPYPARGGGYEAGGYRERDRVPPAVASVRADPYVSHRAAAPQQPRAYVDPYDAPAPRGAGWPHER